MQDILTPSNEPHNCKEQPQSGATWPQPRPATMEPMLGGRFSSTPMLPRRLFIVPSNPDERRLAAEQTQLAERSVMRPLATYSSSVPGRKGGFAAFYN